MFDQYIMTPFIWSIPNLMQSLSQKCIIYDFFSFTVEKFKVFAKFAFDHDDDVVFTLI